MSAANYTLPFKGGRIISGELSTLGVPIWQTRQVNAAYFLAVMGDCGCEAGLG